jgi:antitoxin component YwqK of YwqJK toxin-antitoxin module
MSKKTWPYVTISLFFLNGCMTGNMENTILSQKFIHKYGFDISEQEWASRDQEGQIVSMLKNGVKVVTSYENGILHGPTTHTFPNSPIVEHLFVYDQGTLIKEILNDSKGIPISENAYEFDDRKILTLWDENGAPISIEEFDGEFLVEGSFFTPEHELEGKVESGFGERSRRDRTGLLICRELIENGVVSRHTSFHPNGHIHSISNYHDYQLHGEQKKFTSLGKPLMDLHWDHGVLNGLKVVYRDGVKASEIPYCNGQKHGLEIHFDDLSNKTAEIEWKNDKKYGCSRFFTNGTEEQEWFYNGSVVSQEKFEMLYDRAGLVSELIVE